MKDTAYYAAARRFIYRTLFPLFTGGVGSAVLGMVPLVHDRVSSNDEKYAAQLSDVPEASNGISKNNRRVIDMVSNLANRKRLLEVVRKVRSTEVLLYGGAHTCHRWLYGAATAIGSLPQEYWNNDEYVMESIVWKLPPDYPSWADHGSLAVRIKATGERVYFDNGFLGDSPGMWDFPWIRGGIFFADEPKLQEGFSFEDVSVRVFPDMPDWPGRY